MIWQTLKETLREINQEKLITVAASVSFYVLLSLVPALSTTITVYRLIYDPATIFSQLSGVLSFAPTAVSDLILEQATRLTMQTPNQKWLTFTIGFLISAWSANAGIKAIFSALNEVHDLTETRGFFRLTLISLATTATALVLFVLALTSIALLPAMLAFVPFARQVNVLLLMLHWPVFLVVATLAIAALYRIGPSWEPPTLSSLLPGAFVAALMWVLISAGFSWYTSTLANYSATYGSLATVVVFMTWLWFSTLSVLAGAAFNVAVSVVRGEPKPVELPA